MEKWYVAAKKADFDKWAKEFHISPVTARILRNRDLTEESEIQRFLYGKLEDCYSPWLLKDMDKAVKRINRALDDGESICIYGDYDCDGVTSTALLYTFLSALGGFVSYYIPNRATDGYGMNFKAIDKIKADGTDLIITVDNGISSIEEAEYIYSLGMQLIVTDHHQIGENLPRAEAVINPHREDNEIEFRDFAGVGVAFKLACALYDGDVEDLLEDYADYVTIGTIGDMVPLLNENRAIVKSGLKLINTDAKIGISALKKSTNSKAEHFSATDVAFQICPRINAAGRMDTANLAVDLLTCEDNEIAEYKAEQLNLENTHRHEVEEKIDKDIAEIMANDRAYQTDRVIVVAGHNYHKGVIGICAAHLVELYSKPAIVIGIDDEGNATGSARSIDGFNIFEAISNCSDILTHFGGHPLAAGMGLNVKDIAAFRKRINDFAKNNYPVMPIQTLKIDCKLSPYYLTLDLVNNLAELEPFGTDNAQPVFGLYNLTLTNVAAIGDGKHLKIEAAKKGKSVRMVKFRTTLDEFPHKIGDTLDFAVKLSKSTFKNKDYISAQIVDFRKSGIDIDKYYREKNDYLLFKLGKKNKTELYPNRDICAVVYKYLKSQKGYKYTFDDLYFELANYLTYGQLAFALDAFEEAGLIKREGNITLNDVKTKANLERTDTLTVLKGRL